MIKCLDWRVWEIENVEKAFDISGVHTVASMHLLRAP